MGIDVSVVRVFTAADGRFGNHLGIVDAAVVPHGRRQDIAAELGYSETIFVDLPGPGSGTAHVQIFTPATELPFAGHPTVGAAWWLREREVGAAEPSEFPDDAVHYLWSWVDRDAGHIRSRVFAANLGVPEDEATGSAAVRITDHLSRDLTITQGRGSQIFTTWDSGGWVTVSGRVVSDGIRQLS